MPRVFAAETRGALFGEGVFLYRKACAAICRGIQILTAAGVVTGRALTASPAVRPEVEMARGIYIGMEPNQVCCDGNLITAPPAILHTFTHTAGDFVYVRELKLFL